MSSKSNMDRAKRWEEEEAIRKQQMSSKNNMEMTKWCHVWLWIAFCTGLLCHVIGLRFSQAKTPEPAYPYRAVCHSLELLAYMGMMMAAGSGLAALKREIADLKSGDADDSTATQGSE